ncbi:hypothetical protein CFC21_002058 [Triticum aestivum]|uniref:Uncharacterized protein n=2 Tax=Triticum TaxID=4564 RepID=A0A9R0QAE9_TRITD|nr:hypothetical protein CFC21_002058 [Triticum aestivum]VAH05805.1 unnamed protein product [Triticum turgidum subsp. durum]
MAMRQPRCSIFPRWRIWRQRQQGMGGEELPAGEEAHLTGGGLAAMEEERPDVVWPWWGRREPAVRQIRQKMGMGNEREGD